MRKNYLMEGYKVVFIFVIIGQNLLIFYKDYLINLSNANMEANLHLQIQLCLL